MHPLQSCLMTVRMGNKAACTLTVDFWPSTVTEQARSLPMVIRVLCEGGRNGPTSNTPEAYPQDRPQPLARSQHPPLASWCAQQYTERPTGGVGDARSSWASCLCRQPRKEHMKTPSYPSSNHHSLPAPGANTRQATTYPPQCGLMADGNRLGPARTVAKPAMVTKQAHLVPFGHQTAMCSSKVPTRSHQKPLPTMSTVTYRLLHRQAAASPRIHTLSSPLVS